MKIILVHSFDSIISIQNLLSAWQEFLKGKKNKIDVNEFQSKLMDNIFDLHNDLKNKTYKHGEYKAFKIIDSFHNFTISTLSLRVGKGLPLGNLTSQLLVNIYMNEFDQFVKRELQIKYYIRYADDFIVLSEDKKYLEERLERMKEFLGNNLRLNVHPDKVYIKTICSGVDFLGWVSFPDHRVLRTSTKRRMFRNIRKSSKKETIQSYLGMLSHGNGYKLQKSIENNPKLA